MSALYGDLRGDRPREVTRRGFSRMSAHIRGWDFGIRVKLNRDARQGAPDILTASFQLTGGSNDDRGMSPVFEFRSGFDYTNLNLIVPAGEMDLEDKSCRRQFVTATRTI